MKNVTIQIEKKTRLILSYFLMNITKLYVKISYSGPESLPDKAMLLMTVHHMRRPLGLLPGHCLMGPHKAALLHRTTTFLVTVSLRRKITPFTIGMRVSPVASEFWFYVRDNSAFAYIK